MIRAESSGLPDAVGFKVSGGDSPQLEASRLETMHMDYGRALRVVRASRNISQKELAQKAGLTPSYVSLIESGRRDPAMAALKAVCKALNVPLYLFTLLASDDEDLVGISQQDAHVLGQQLLELLRESEDGTQSE